MRTPPTMLEVVLINIICALVLLWLYLFSQQSKSEPEFLGMSYSAAGRGICSAPTPGPVFLVSINGNDTASAPKDGTARSAAPSF